MMNSAPWGAATEVVVAWLFDGVPWSGTPFFLPVF
jgi:hypothetical protein